MKPFALHTEIKENQTFAEYAKEAGIGPDDLILTNEYIYTPKIKSGSPACRVLFQEKYGAGEPTDVMAEAILNDLRGQTIGRIIAVGGGTIIDLAKIISVSDQEDRSVDALYDRKDHLTKKHPLTVIPTTCGTGSEVTDIAVLARTRLGVKMGLAAPALYPDQAVLIPDLLSTLPYRVFATSSIDAMIHAVESYLSPNACVYSELFSVSALHQIIASWSAAVKAGVQEGWKVYAKQLLEAADFAGIAFGYAGCAAVHATSYPIGAVYHVPHGQSNQMMFASVMKQYQKLAPVGKINSLEQLLAEDLHCQPETALAQLVVLMNQVLPAQPLHEAGVKKEDIPVFAHDVIKTQQRLLNNNYTKLTEADLIEIYQRAF